MPPNDKVYYMVKLSISVYIINIFNTRYFNLIAKRVPRLLKKPEHIHIVIYDVDGDNWYAVASDSLSKEGIDRSDFAKIPKQFSNSQIY